MRLRLFLIAHQPLSIPWSYRTFLTALIYETLRAADPNYAQWLHDVGFRWGKRSFRLFVYSDLLPTHYRLTPKGLSDVHQMTWQVGSPDPRFLETFLKGLNRRGWKWKMFGTVVEVVEALTVGLSIVGEKMTFRTISPIAVSVGEPERSKHPIYLSPEDPRFIDGLKNNLIAKW